MHRYWSQTYCVWSLWSYDTDTLLPFFKVSPLKEAFTFASSLEIQCGLLAAFGHVVLSIEWLIFVQLSFVYGLLWFTHMTDLLVSWPASLQRDTVRRRQELNQALCSQDHSCPIHLYIFLNRILYSAEFLPVNSLSYIPICSLSHAGNKNVTLPHFKRSSKWPNIWNGED